MGKSFAKYLFALILFGLNGIISSYISLSSYEIVFLRTIIGSLLLLAIFLFTRPSFTCRPPKNQLFSLAASGIAMGASWMFLYEAYQQIGVSLASLTYYCGPVIVMLLSPVLFKEKLTYSKLTGFAAVICGIFLVNGQAFQQKQMGWGLFCGAMSAVTYAIMIIFNKKAKDITGLENSLLQLVFSFLTVAVFVGLKQGLVIPIQSSDWIPVLILGLINTGLGCYFYFSSIGQLPVQTVAVCSYLEPLSAVIFSVLLLHETLLPLQILGGILILGGAVFSEIKR